MLLQQAEIAYYGGHSSQGLHLIKLFRPMIIRMHYVWRRVRFTTTSPDDAVVTLAEPRIYKLAST